MLAQQKPFQIFDFLSRLEKTEVVTLFQTGEPAEVEAKARRITERYPAEVFGWNVLGMVLLRQGESTMALPNLIKALALSPREADIHNNCGVAFLKLGRFDEAVSSFRQAVELRPDAVTSLNNLANALDAAGRPEEAVNVYTRSLAVDPDQARIHYNLGNLLKDLGKLEKARQHYERTIAIAPDHAYAMTNLALTLADLGRSDSAETLARSALLIDTDLIEAQNLLATLMLDRDAPGEALPWILRSLALEERLETKTLFATCVQRLPVSAMDAELIRLLVRALSEPWTRPNTLATFAARVLGSDQNLQRCLSRAEANWPAMMPVADLFGPDGPAALADNPLLASVLIAGPVCDLRLERFLTLARRALLDAVDLARPEKGSDPALLTFPAALARQCHINEYVFAQTPEETEQVTALRQSVLDALAQDRLCPPMWVVTLAAYEPLSSLPGAGRLVSDCWTEPVRAVVNQQVIEPARERDIQERIPELTPIRDTVSREVRHQYEENPYPRWITPAPTPCPTSLQTALRQRFPRMDMTPAPSGNRLDVLVAGCGTGQHSIETARRYSGAQVLAVDLSLASLGYAQRKTEECGLDNLEYAQADILGLGTMGRRFDLIESSGVLHHLGDPFAGWRVLTSLLRPGGFMRIGLYSQLARQSITRIRGALAASGETVSAQSIRDKRQSILASYAKDMEQITRLEDFFTASGCRDLLFHVQEHCLAIPAIKAYLDAEGLVFLGFDVTSKTLRAYHRSFPGDASATNLDNWHRFEQQHPDTFIEMYQFWLRKPA